MLRATDLIVLKALRIWFQIRIRNRNEHYCWYFIEKAIFDTPKANEAKHSVNYVVWNSIHKTLKFHKIREATQNGQILTKICDAIFNNQCRFYKSDIHMKFASVFKLIFSDGATLRKQKLVFRHCLHHYISRLAHRGHIAIEKSKTGLRSKV